MFKSVILSEYNESKDLPARGSEPWINPTHISYQSPF